MPFDPAAPGPCPLWRDAWAVEPRQTGAPQMLTRRVLLTVKDPDGDIVGLGGG